MNSDNTNELTPLEDWMDAQEACNFLKVRKKTLDDYRYKGLLKFSKIKKKVYFKKTDLRKLLDDNYNK